MTLDELQVGKRAVIRLVLVGALLCTTNAGLMLEPNAMVIAAVVE